ACSRWHLDSLDCLSRGGIESPEVALVTFPGSMPEFAVDPGDPGDEAIALDGAKDRACLRVDLMNLARPVVPHPKRAFGPRQPRIAPTARRRNRRDHTAGIRIDLLDAILGDLKQIAAVEGGPCVRG